MQSLRERVDELSDCEDGARGRASHESHEGYQNGDTDAVIESSADIGQGDRKTSNLDKSEETIQQDKATNDTKASSHIPHKVDNFDDVGSENLAGDTPIELTSLDDGTENDDHRRDLSSKNGFGVQEPSLNLSEFPMTSIKITPPSPESIHDFEARPPPLTSVTFDIPPISGREPLAHDASQNTLPKGSSGSSAPRHRHLHPWSESERVQAISTRSLEVFDKYCCFAERHDDDFVEYDLEPDTFALMFLYPQNSFAFNFAIFVYMLQMTLLWLILFDLLSSGSESNVFNVPVAVDSQVRGCQFVTMILAVVSLGDLTVTLNQISVGYDGYLLDEGFPGASTSNWILANVLRFSEALLILSSSFVFIVQSDNVLDIFFNFAAIYFVGDLDNIAFDLARDGFIGLQLRREALQAENVSLPESRKRKRLRVLMKILLLIVLGSIMIISWSIISHRQMTGFYLLSPNVLSKNVEVNFSDEAYRIQSNINTTLNGTDVGELPPLLFEYFSGTYTVASSSRINNRPVYSFQANENNYSGVFSYCEGLGAWIFTIPALKGAIPDATRGECGSDGWLARSPSTEAVVLDNVPSEGWKAWTGRYVSLDVGVVSLKCEEDSECGLIGGTCVVDNTCECYNGFVGAFCTDPQPIARLLGSSSNASNALKIFYRIGDFLYYDRPVWISVNQDSLEAEFLIFSGRRWQIVLRSLDSFVLGLGDWCAMEGQDAHVTEVLIETIRLDFGVAYWDSILVENSLLFSEVTTMYHPTFLRWFERTSNLFSCDAFYSPFSQTKEVEWVVEPVEAIQDGELVYNPKIPRAELNSTLCDSFLRLLK